MCAVVCFAGLLKTCFCFLESVELVDRKVEELPPPLPVLEALGGDDDGEGQPPPPYSSSSENDTE